MMDSILLYKGCGHSINTKLSNKMLEISLNVLKTLNNISAINSESIMVIIIKIKFYKIQIRKKKNFFEIK